MHKKLAADLTSLAHSILQMKNKDDVFALKEKAYEVYEKLSVLAYVEEYINTTPNAEHTKEELLEKIEQAAEKIEQNVEEAEPKEKVVVHKLEEVDVEVEEETVEEAIEEPTVVESSVASEDVEEEPKATEEAVEEIEEEPTDEAEKEVPVIELSVEDSKTNEETVEEVVKEIEEKAMELIEDVSSHVEEEVKEAVEFLEEEKKVPSLDEELKDTIAVDVVADLFENATKKSLNDKLHGDIQIGLNDRIAFVKNLFDGSQEDFNRVVSQLNTFKTEKEAKKFLNKMVKPDYDWSAKEEYEERFMTIVERKFA